MRELTQGGQMSWSGRCRGDSAGDESHRLHPSHQARSAAIRYPHRLSYCHPTPLPTPFLFLTGGSVANCYGDLHVLDTHAIPMTWTQLSGSGVAGATARAVAPRAGHSGLVVGTVWYIVGGGNNVKGERGGKGGVRCYHPLISVSPRAWPWDKALIDFL